jgi:hypothetical protein
MRLLLAATLALIAACAAARADLGDTLPQVEARYGAAQGTKKDAPSGVITKFYIHDGLGIAVKFLDATSQSEIYVKGDKTAFSGPELARLLKANAMGSDWSSIYKTAGVERWVLKSREATAVYSHTSHIFIFSTKAFIRASGRIRIIDPGS